MRERPIPFSAPMVRALLAGTKTQTRRVVKPQPRRVDGGVPFGDAPAWAHAEPGSAVMRCPYGRPGDRLWVREAWRTYASLDHLPPRHIAAGAQVWYEADTGLPGLRGLVRQGKLRPGMFMPRWASRITLEVTGVRVERLQDISEADAIAEGQRDGGDNSHARWGFDGVPGTFCDCPVTAYAALWESINGPGSWDANPYCWVVCFRRI
jgi:hypothetical protein